MPLNNENNNDCCKCTTPQYELTLNQQGPQGKTGPQGEPGFTPTIVVNTNTDRVYSLTINTIDGQIVTPNLKASVPGDGPAGYVLTKNTSTPYDMSFQAIPQATETQSGILQLATITDTQPDEEDEVDDTKAVTPNVLVEYVEQEIDNLNISNYVTLNTEQTITGNKNFQGITEFRGTRFGSQYNILNPNHNQYNGGFQMLDLANEGGFNPQLINANSENDNGSYPGFGFLGNNPENTSITDNKYKNAIGVDLYGQTSHPIISIKNGILGDIIDSNDIATTTTAGIVKPDGTTITVDADGTIHSVGGTGGTEDYTELTNKPQINGVELTGNQDGNTLGLANESEVTELGNEVNQLAGDVTNLTTTVGNKADKSELSNYVDLTSEQTIPAIKIFQNGISIDNIVSPGEYGATQIGPNHINYRPTNPEYQFFQLRPFQDNTGELRIGNTNAKWNSVNINANGLYLNGEPIGGGEAYVLPPATTTTLGGIKVGSNLSITEDGTLSATGTAPTNMVTIDTEQTITGIKTFSRWVFAQQPLRVDKINSYQSNANYISYDGSGQGSVTLNAVNLYHQIPGVTGLSDILDSKNLTKYLIAGSNITLTPDSTGKITIASTGGGELPSNVLTSDNISQDAYIQQLEARIAALEALIDGGNAQTNGVVAYQNTTLYADSAIVNNGLVGQDTVTIQDGEV